MTQPDRCGLQPPEPPHPPSSILPYSFCRSPRAALGVFCTASSLFSISHHITAAPASSPATGYTSSDPQLTPSPSFSGYSLTLMLVLLVQGLSWRERWRSGVHKPWLCAPRCSGFAFWTSQNSQFPFANRFVLSLGDTPSLCKCYKSGVSDPLFTNCCCFPLPAPIRGSAHARNVTVASCDRWY